MEDIDLADIAGRAAGLLAVKASDHQIRIEAPNADETLPAVGEFRRALQIMVNLIGNAIRYSPEHSTIWIRVEGEGDLAKVKVADQGRGIAPQDQDKIFDKFERLGRDEARSEEHTSELQSLMRISYAVFCLKKKTKNKSDTNT